MNGRTPTAIERDWLDKCQQLPCIVCDRFHGIPDTPCEIHHIRGQTRPDAHLSSISLCRLHHRHADPARPKRWISRHGDGRQEFEQRYAPEDQLLTWQQERVRKLEQNMV